MDYKGLLEKLDRVIATCGVRISFIEDSIGIGRNTMSHYRIERLRNKSGKNYPLSDIEHHIENGDITLLKKNKAEFLMEIIDQMNVKRYFLDNFDSVIFTGGGSEFLGEIIKTKLPQNCRLHENPIKSNMLGAMLLGKQILGVK
ncbi:hypothetical protein psyc5s11_36730 [Clostridium gelidum]|uniref:Uncharacterized protein n=1 Tax=Clostridium gelidum TaxID=704125 RepID=A0ABM7T864_9CLOT|nr:hypothetical protein [Clostridium gelidum]BCZ47606.1 hypothetical protein psyc5s11_36730 [Clostridium gelidum]